MRKCEMPRTSSDSRGSTWVVALYAFVLLMPMISEAATEAAVTLDTPSLQTPGTGTVQGWQFTVSEDLVVTSLGFMDGPNGGWAQLFGQPFADPTKLSMSVDEDQLGDTERSHTTEQVSFIVFEFHVTVPDVP